MAQQGLWNAYRVAHPKRNTYRPMNSQATGNAKRDNEPAAPSLNATVRAAAALLAEHHARQKQANGTLYQTYELPQEMGDRSAASTAAKLESRKNKNGWWAANVPHKGLAPMGYNSSWMVRPLRAQQGRFDSSDLL